MKETRDQNLRSYRKHSPKHGKDRNNVSLSETDSYSSPSSATEESELQSSDEEHRRKRKRERDRDSKRHHRKKGEKNKELRKDSKKRKSKKKRHRSDDSESSEEDDRRKKRRLLKEARKILKRRKKNQDNSIGGGDNTKFKELTEENYFEKNKEFSTWLKEEHGVYFSSLTSDEARKLFMDFVEAWNGGKLAKKLYQGIDHAARTSHKWEFKGEKEVLMDREEELEFMKKLEKAQRKKFRKNQAELLDELLPKATGKDRTFEIRAFRREQARAREESPELMKEQDIMGGGDDYKLRLAKERAWKEKKQSERAEAFKERKSAFEEKEAAAMSQFRELVNVAGGKITIPKRMDPM